MYTNSKNTTIYYNLFLINKDVFKLLQFVRIDNLSNMNVVLYRLLNLAISVYVEIRTAHDISIKKDFIHLG